MSADTKPSLVKSETYLATMRSVSLGSLLTASRALSKSTSSGFRLDAVCHVEYPCLADFHSLQMRPMLVSIALTVVFVSLGVSFQKARRTTCVLCRGPRTWQDGGSTMKICGCPRDVVVAAWFGVKALLIFDAIGFSYGAR